MSHLSVDSIIAADTYNRLMIDHEATERAELLNLKYNYLPALSKTLTTHGVADFVELHLLHRARSLEEILQRIKRKKNWASVLDLCTKGTGLPNRTPSWTTWSLTPTDTQTVSSSPSTNFYVGLEAKHYTVPKRLLYHFSGYAKLCLERDFLEAGANAIWLPDVDPDVLQWLWHWLYTGKLKVHRYYCGNLCLSVEEQLQVANRVLCRLHMLGERLLFDDRFLHFEVRQELSIVVEKAAASKAFTTRAFTPLTREVVEEVLVGSAPVEYGSVWEWYCLSLRPFTIRQLCNFDICTKNDFINYADCFELDGAFAAGIMVFITDEVKWAVERWEGQIDSPVDITDVKKKFAAEQSNSKCMERGPKKRQDFLLVLRIMCTYAECTTTDLRAYSQCFELDGNFAAEISEYKAKELLWVLERWGEERGAKVSFAAEKEEEERVAQEESDLQHMVDKIMRRAGWT